MSTKISGDVKWNSPHPRVYTKLLGQDLVDAQQWLTDTDLARDCVQVAMADEYSEYTWVFIFNDQRSCDFFRLRWAQA